MFGLQKIFQHYLKIRAHSWFLYLDDEVDPKDVDEHESASFGEESPRSKDRMESRCEGIQGAADQTVQYAGKLGGNTRYHGFQRFP